MILGASTIFSDFNELKFFISTKQRGVSPPPYYLNMSFSVNDDEDNVKRNREIFFNAIKINQNEIALPRQIHSDIVKVADEPGIYPDCDALITNKKFVYLGISVADCVPIFLYDPKKHAVGAIHSGWQGSSKKILNKALKAMTDIYGCNPKDIFAYIGYSAGGCCYEVGKDVASFFDKSFIQQKSEVKYLLDLKKFNHTLLTAYEVPENQIEVSEFCTICNPNFLHSYRRDGLKSGRMLGVIGLTE